MSYNKSQKDNLPISSRPEDYDHNFPNFRRPTIFGSFSLDGSRAFHHDRHQMMYLYKRGEDRAGMDLNKGINIVIRKNEEQTKCEQLDNVLKWILNNKKMFLVKETDEKLSSLNTDVVCYRGLLTTIMCSPYEAREGWELLAVKWRGTLYLCQVETEQRKRQRLSETPRQKTMSSWGYKFEQFMVSPHPGIEPNTDTAVNENEEFCCVFRTRLDKFSLVYGAEMDGYDSSERMGEKEVLVPEKFIEMKTSRVIEHQRQQNNFFRFKVLKWWCQSFLVGIQDILVGWRDDDGLVTEVETMKVSRLAKNAVQWKPNVCANFLAQFLSVLSENIRGDDVNRMYKVVRQPGRGIEMREFFSEHGGTFLPRWYTDGLF